MICTYSKEFTKEGVTGIENAFISQYLPLAGGDAVKVYLYGLYTCGNVAANQDLTTFCKAINCSEETVKSAFSFWEEFGLVTVMSEEPYVVRYHSVSEAGYNKPRKFKAEKFGDFSKGAQSLISGRMISTNEYAEYFTIIETYSVSADAMLMIIKYCVDLKGNDIGYKYIVKVAKDFALRGITTVEKVEKELSSYVLRTGELEKILKAISVKKRPDIEDLNYYKKWTQELSFEPENVLFVAKLLKKSTMAKLDAFLLELFGAKSFSPAEIENYAREKQRVYDLAVKFNKALSVYVEVLDTEVDEYLKKWLSYGFTEPTLLLLANRLFKDGKNSLKDADSMIEDLRKKGIIDISSVTDYFEREKRTEEFLKKMLLTCGINRRPTPWDKENLALWKSWNFSEEMILEAAKISAGKSSPTAYMSGVLSKWKNKEIFDLTAVTEDTAAGASEQEEYNREYERRRTLAATRAQNNLEKARSSEEFSKIYERLFGIEKDLAFAEIAKDEKTLSSLETEKEKLTEKAESILSEMGLSLSDLSPKYACEKCNDTGYIGSHRCDCYGKLVK